MHKEFTYKVHPKEKVYFTIKVIVSLIVYFLILGGSIYGVSFGYIKLGYIIFYLGLVVLSLLLGQGLLIGHLKGNAIKVGTTQFPDIYEIVEKQSNILRLSAIPDMYLLESGGLLNAFATKFLGRNYLVIYTDIIETAYEESTDSVEFIIGHELGHIKRNHITKDIFLFPSFIIPFLNKAYSRGCEYTCDDIGAAMNLAGAETGLLILASGKKLYKKVNVDMFISQNITDGGFWTWFAEKISTHPMLVKRIARFRNINIKKIPPIKFENLESEKKKIERVEETEDHSRYMPY